MSKTFDDLLSKVNSCDKKKLAVAVAQDQAVLEAVKAAKERNIADSILVGDADKINEIRALSNEIVELKIKLSELKNTKKCPDCGEVLFRKKGKVPMIVCHNEKCDYKRKAEDNTEETNEEN